MVWNKLLICFLLVFWKTDRNNAQSLRNSQAEVRSEIDAANYLSGRNWIPAGGASATVDLIDLLRNFQMYTGLPVTGILDEATKAKMNSPQCGNPDFGEGGFTVSVTRKKRYTHLKSRWPHEITWYLENGTPDLNINIVRSKMIRAFQHWADVIPLTFREVFSTNADIIVQFAVGDHGDGNSFDGPGRVLAHAFQPGHGRGGDIHFDDDEQFTTSTGINLLQVAVHEIGHSLGMGHSNDINAIMAPYYTYRANFALGSDDINGIQALYGENRHGKCRTSQLQDGSLRYYDSDDTRTFIPRHGDYRIATCNECYSLEGTSRTQCLEGEWIDELPICQENLGNVHLDVRTALSGDNYSRLVVSWQLPNLTVNCNITHQELTIHQLDLDNCNMLSRQEADHREVLLEPGEQRRAFRRLSPNSLFNITYLATHLEGTYVTSQLNRTPTFEPSGEPTNLHHTSRLDRVDLSWDMPLCGERNGEIKRYEFIAQTHYGETFRQTRRPQYSIQPLFSGDQWTFRVRACNEAGCGPFATSSGQLD